MKLNFSRHYIFFAERTVANEAVSYAAYCLFAIPSYSLVDEVSILPCSDKPAWVIDESGLRIDVASFT